MANLAVGLTIALPPTGFMGFELDMTELNKMIANWEVVLFEKFPWAEGIVEDFAHVFSFLVGMNVDQFWPVFKLNYIKMDRRHLAKCCKKNHFATCSLDEHTQETRNCPRMTYMNDMCTHVIALGSTADM